jgi:hypothetical protein
LTGVVSASGTCNLLFSIKIYSQLSLHALSKLDIIMSIYPVLKIGNVIIWDLTDFDEADILQLLASDEI